MRKSSVPSGNRQRRVLIALGWYDHRLHRGIEKYAQEHDWHLCSDVTKERVIPWGWEGDGILAWLGSGDDLADFVLHAEKPTVDFSYRRRELPFPHVLVDHAAAARLAADYFISHGLTNFIYYSDVDNWAFEESGRGFVQTLSEAGHGCNWLRWHRSPAFTTGHLEWKHKRHWLAAQLKQAPKPVAVFAANDNHALDVLEACDDAQLVVPEQVAIIGMDNSLLAVDAMRTPVSSVDTNLEMVGYEGAALLDGLMNGHTAPKEPVRVPPAGLIIRKSCDLLAVKHKGVAAGLKFIWENYHKPVTIKDVVSASAMSRRGLYTAFMEHLNRSPGEELHRVRIDQAKKLLGQPEHKIEAIALMCGYSSANSFWVTFKTATGMSPRQFREKIVH